MATVPNVCKTPPNNLPVPYPNIAFSRNLAKGTTTVKADGGNMCANYGSEFSSSTGDEAGRLGGVASGTVGKEATWITYSFDVKLQGKGACRLTDKMFHNHQNTVNMGGELQGPILDNTGELLELKILCTLMCEVKDIPGHKQTLIASALWKIDDELKGCSTMKAEVPMNIAKWSNSTPNSLPTPITEYLSSKGSRATRFWGRIPEGETRRPDVLITTAEPIEKAELRKAVEMKFDDAKTPHSDDQRELFKQMFGEKYLEMELGEDCICDDDPKRRKEELKTKEERKEFVEKLVTVAKERKRQLEEEAGPSLLERLTPSAGTLAVGAGLVALGAAAIFFGPELAAGAGIAALFSLGTT
jgi:hypothetical protein